MNATNELLLQAGSGTEALRRLLEWNRQSNPKWSYAWLAKQWGISSRGYISDIMSGRRVLPKKLWQPCLETLNLKGPGLKYCLALLAVEEQVLDNEEPTADVLGRLDAARKRLRGQDASYSDRVLTDPMTLQVHSAFGLFSNSPTRRQLIQFFGRQHSVSIESALQTLMVEGIIERRLDHFILRPEAQDLFLVDLKGNKGKIVRFLRLALEQSKGAVESWIDQPTVAAFRSCNICVKRGSFEKRLEQLREDLFNFQNEIAQEDGDMLVRFDFQFYPLGEKPSAESPDSANGT